jgi:hypothetical protein
MPRLLLSWISRIHLLRLLLIPLAITIVAALLDKPWVGMLIAMTATTVLLCALVRRERYFLSLLVRFGRYTRLFQEFRNGDVLVRFDSMLSHDAAAQVSVACRDTVNELTKRFGHGLRRPLLVYLFRSAGEMSVLFRSSFGGASFGRADLIILAGDSHQERIEVIRHELAHLFSSYWTSMRPRLLEEGLATWMMQTSAGKKIDCQAILLILTDRYLCLDWLLDSSVFYYRSHQTYVLAGSFTGWLIEHFGWDKYCDFYRYAHRKGFSADFEKAYGLTLLAAEHQWREELLQRRPTFEPDLTLLLAQYRLDAALIAGHYYRLLEESTSIIKAGLANARVFSCTAHAHAMLGGYAEAAALESYALQHDDSKERLHGGADLFLGNLYDLQGQRDEAIKQYQKILLNPDDWLEELGTLHGAARAYLKRPFTQNDLQILLMSTLLMRVRDETRRPLGRMGRLTKI